MSEPSPRSGWFLLWLWMVSLAALVALYSGSFQNKPAGDDFSAPLTEIERGQTEGPLVFFQQSAQPHNYRPIQSLLMWAFGSISDSTPQQLVWIRVLHLLCMAAYLGVTAMWLARLPIGQIGAIASMMLMTVHPVLAGAGGGIDGFAGSLASAFMWLGALAVIVWIDRLAVLLPVIVLCFLIGGITKEYSFGLGPLAVWSALVFSKSHRWRNAAVIGFTLIAALSALVYVRLHTIPPGEEAGFSYLYLSPAIWIKNIGLLTIAVLFMGNTVWVMLRDDTVAHSVVAGSMMGMFMIVGLGLLCRWQGKPAANGDAASLPPVTPPSADRWIVYLLGSIPLAAAAPLLTEFVSELYATGLVLPLALLFGIAIDGWSKQGVAMKWVGILCAAVTIVVGAISCQAKIALLHDVGEQAEARLNAMLAVIPPEAKDVDVAVVYRVSDVAGQPRYSLYVMNDFTLIAQRKALMWIVPERGVMLEVIVVDNLSPVELPQFKYVLLWRPELKGYELLK